MNVFVAGPRKVTNLNNHVKERLYNIINNNFNILVGDANGIDKAIQKFLYNENYPNVMVYAVDGKARNNIGGWNIKNIDSKDKKRKDFAYYTLKDKVMAQDATWGFMIWNGSGKGTLNNMINLTSTGKKTLLYFIPEKEFYTFNDLKQLKSFIEKSDSSILNTFYELLDYNNITYNNEKQLSIDTLL